MYLSPPYHVWTSAIRTDLELFMTWGLLHCFFFESTFMQFFTYASIETSACRLRSMSTLMETPNNIHGSEFSNTTEISRKINVIAWTIFPPTSTDVNQLPCQLPPTSMEGNILLFTSVEVASLSGFIDFHDNFHLFPSASVKDSTGASTGVHVSWM